MNSLVETYPDEELIIRVFAYVEREDGRDAPLLPADVELIRRLLESDAEVRAIAAGFRETNTCLDDFIEEAGADVPPALINLVRNYEPDDTEAEANEVDDHSVEDLGDNRTSIGLPINSSEGVGVLEDSKKIIPFERATTAKPLRSFIALAAAASIALIIGGGTVSLYLSQVHQQDRLLFQSQLQRASTVLATSSQKTSQVKREQRGLRVRIASLENENRKLERTLGISSLQTGTLNSPIGSPMDELGDHQSPFQQRMAELTGALYDRELQLKASQTQLKTAMQEKQASSQEEQEKLLLQQQLIAKLKDHLGQARRDVTTLATARKTLENSVTQNEQQLASLERSFTNSLGKILELNTANNDLASEKERYREEASWLNQVAGYHRGYAGTKREVEVSAEDQRNKQTLTKWFANMMIRDFSVPNLSDSELTFVGGRLFFVNGKPTGQIAYHDAQGRLAGFCFTVNKDKADSEPTTKQDDDLNLVSWTKNGVDYVMVGWTEAPLLESIASELRQSYGNDI